MLSDSSDYLRSLHSSLLKDPSFIKHFIRDIPVLYSELNFTSRSQQFLVFSRLESEDEEEMLCEVIQNLLKRVSIVHKRSKQAFTSMWDGIRRALQCILDDALTLKNRSNGINRLLRLILHHDIRPTIEMIKCNCDWLCMDLDVQAKKIIQSNFTELPEVTCDLDLKTLFLYCDQFFIPQFAGCFDKIACPTDDLIKLLFKECYFQPYHIISLINRPNSFKNSCFMDCLIKLDASKWALFDENSLMTIINYACGLNNQNKLFSLLVNITDSLDLRSANISNIRNILNFYFEYPMEELTDAALSKYWIFAFSVLSSESLKFEFRNFLESNIIHTMKKPNSTFQKSKCAVCRVIAINWVNLKDPELVFDSLVSELMNPSSSSKLKWNISVALMNFASNYDQNMVIQKICMSEIEKFSNFKVMAMLTWLVIKWALNHQELENLRERYGNVLWEALGKVKKFIVNNEGSMECCDEWDEKMVDNAVKLEQHLKFILIDSEFNNV